MSSFGGSDSFTQSIRMIAKLVVICALVGVLTCLPQNSAPRAGTLEVPTGQKNGGPVAVPIPLQLPGPTRAKRQAHKNPPLPGSAGRPQVDPVRSAPQTSLPSRPQVEDPNLLKQRSRRDNEQPHISTLPKPKQRTRRDNQKPHISTLPKPVKQHAQ